MRNWGCTAPKAEAAIFGTNQQLSQVNSRHAEITSCAVHWHHQTARNDARLNSVLAHCRRHASVTTTFALCECGSDTYSLSWLLISVSRFGHFCHFSQSVSQSFQLLQCKWQCKFIMCHNTPDCWINTSQKLIEYMVSRFSIRPMCKTHIIQQ